MIQALDDDMDQAPALRTAARNSCFRTPRSKKPLNWTPSVLKSASADSTTGSCRPLRNAIWMTGRSMGSAMSHQAVVELPVMLVLLRYRDMTVRYLFAQ